MTRKQQGNNFMKLATRIKQIVGDNQNIILLTLVGIAVVLVLLVLTTRTSDLSSGPAVDNQARSSTTSRQVRGDRLEQKEGKASSTETDTTSNIATTSDPEEFTTEPTDPFGVPLTAESAIVWDQEAGEVLYEKKADEERPLASLTKLMTALVAAETNSDLGMPVQITSQHLAALGDSGLVANQTWDLRDLIGFMLMESSNDAARAVASASSTTESDGYYAKQFIDRMNTTAENIGLESTYFFNPSGLDLNETLISGGYGTARDVAHLFAYILDTNPDILTPTTKSSKVFRSIEGLRYTASNTNTWLAQFDNALGSKTGYTVLAGGNLVMGFDLENPVVIVVLGSTRTGRFQDMQTLYNATQQYFRNNAQSGAFNEAVTTN